MTIVLASAHLEVYTAGRYLHLYIDTGLVSGRFFFRVVEGSSHLVSNKVCSVLCCLASSRTAIFIQKAAVSNLLIKSPSFYALTVHLCFNYFRPVRFNTWLNQPKVCSSMHIDPFGHAELPRAAPSEFGVDIFLKTSSANSPTLLNCRSELHLTTHQTQSLTQ